MATEYEHSFKVKSIKPFIDYCKNNGYKEIGIVKQNRIVYENIFNDKLIARITTETVNEKSTTLVDFKNVQAKTLDLNISKESIPLQLTDENRQQILSILSTLCFKESANNLRIRYIFEKGLVKFEIDDYIRPQMQVVAIEGEKNAVEDVYNQLKNIVDSETSLAK